LRIGSHFGVLIDFCGEIIRHPPVFFPCNGDNGENENREFITECSSKFRVKDETLVVGVVWFWLSVKLPVTSFQLTVKDQSSIHWLKHFSTRIAAIAVRSILQRALRRWRKWQ
jgi:hypothetical protein